MTKRNIGDEIIEGMAEAIEYMKGNVNSAKIHKIEVPCNINVRAIRENLKLSRNAFAHSFGFSPRTLQHWEQGDRVPHGSARVLLFLLQKDPVTIAKILREN